MTISYPEPAELNQFLATEDEEYNWLIPGLLEIGDRLILTGNEGKGKSTFLRQFGVMVAAGVHPFTQELTEAKRVLYVDLENSERQVRRKLREITWNADVDPNQMYVACIPEGVDFSHPAEQQAFSRMLGNIWPDLLIIGPMYKMAPELEKETSSAALAAALDQWRTHFEFSLMMESHQPHQVVTSTQKFRPERPFGSSLWLRWPEFGMCLEDDGHLRPWRGARDVRDWPEKLRHGADWPWVTDKRICLICERDLSPQQEKYCSEKCAATGRKRNERGRERLL